MKTFFRIIIAVLIIAACLFSVKLALELYSDRKKNYISVG